MTSSMLLHENQLPFAQIASAVSDAPLRLGIPDSCEVRSVLVQRPSDNRWVNHCTLLRLGIASSNSDEPQDISVGSARLIASRFSARALGSTSSLQDALTSWRIALPQDLLKNLEAMKDFGPAVKEKLWDFQDGCNVYHNFSTNEFTERPNWVIDLYDRVASHTAFTVPRSTFQNAEADIFAPDLGTLTRNWCLEPAWREANTIQHAYRIVIPDRRAYFEKIRLTGRTLDLHLAGANVIGARCALTSWDVKNNNTIQTQEVAHSRARFNLPESAVRFDVQVLDTSTEWCDRYSRSLQPAGHKTDPVQVRSKKQKTEPLPVRSTKTKPHTVKTFSEAYRLHEQLGEGGSGRVFRATSSDGTDHAIKFLKSKPGSEESRRFKNELNFCLKNAHPNIVTTEEYGITSINGEDVPFFVMPYYAKTLRRLIEEGVPRNQVLVYFDHLLSGVDAAHQLGVWHRDLKPENIFVHNDRESLVVGDFGIAHFSQELLLTLVETKPQSRLANFEYAAPEQRRRRETVDHRADIYALGLILNELFTKHVIHGEGYKTIESVAPELGYLDDIVSAMIQQDASRRPDSVDAIKQQLFSQGNAFVLRQKLSQLSHTVVPVGEVDDPIVANPVRRIGVDWKSDVLVFTLNQRVTPKWEQVFHGLVGISFFPGRGPANVVFRGSTAEITAHEHQAVQIKAMFDEWLAKCEKDYPSMLRRELWEQQAKEQERIRQETLETERRARVLRELGT
jgi:eukaryotic-like serine/threonine-protein kinase